MVNPWHLMVILLAAAVAFAGSVTYALVLDPHPTTDRQAAAQPTSSADRTNCDDIFGTAYRSDAERKWFSEICSAWSAAVGDVPEPSSQGGAPGSSRQPTTPPPNGRDCNQIRGTAYTSNEERSWYIANCQGSAPQPAQAATGPDRTDCNEIRGTPYRSDNEQRWYQANCAGANQQAAAAAGPDRTNCDEIRGTAYRSDNEQRWYQANCAPR